MEYVGHFHFPALPFPSPFSHPSFSAPPPHRPPSHFLFGCEEGERCWRAAASQGYRLQAQWNCWYALVGTPGLARLISSTRAFNWENQSKVSVISELFLLLWCWVWSGCQPHYLYDKFTPGKPIPQTRRGRHFRNPLDIHLVKSQMTGFPAKTFLPSFLYYFLWGTAASL